MATRVPHVIVALALLAAASSVSAEPLRIMPIGDSITAGYTDNPNWNIGFEFGYRSGLYQRLTRAGIDFQYVGESTEPWVSPFAGDLTRGGAYKPPLDLRDFGQDHHRGYGGVAAPFVLQRIADSPAGPGWLTVDDPDVILLHLGTNGQLPLVLDELLEVITTERPDVAIVLAQIVPKLQFQQGIVDYNSYLERRILPKYEGRGVNIALVDHYTPYLTNPADPTSINASLMATGNHPNAAGYDRMAGVWFEGIQRVIAASVLVGDYNADGSVDAADYTFWRDRLGGDGSTLANRDPANTGPVGESDLISWRDAYGEGTPASPVPEPNTAACVGILALAHLGALRRRNARS